MPALPLSLPAATLAAAVGLAAGVVGYGFVYAKGSSYLGNDPATCANCHVMQGHYDGWQKSSHHGFATCNDCHTPSHPILKVVVKAENGFHHSWAFTTGGFPDVIRARPESRAVVEQRCRECHADLVASMGAGHGESCLRCHDQVGHLR
ncbi:MAG TPA: cytochrome c nitrite reductase small subunit [Anaeromyxobacteraceae bacterium]|nr:cytochrome c nitrite reductase small subunit [Anaeromyxobacteraceae bacterium]